MKIIITVLLSPLKNRYWFVSTVALTAFLTVTLFLLSGHAFSQTDFPVDQEALFARIARSAAEIDTIKCDFHQERRVSGFQKELVSRGLFYYQKPDRLRLDQREPLKAGFIVNGKKLKKWRGQERPQVSNVSKDRGISTFAEQVFAWSRADFDWLRKRYAITVLDAQLPVLKLVPLSDEERRFVQGIKISFARPGEIREVEIREKGDDFLRITFDKTVLNGQIDPELF